MEKVPWATAFGPIGLGVVLVLIGLLLIGGTFGVALAVLGGALLSAGLTAYVGGLMAVAILKSHDLQRR